MSSRHTYFYSDGADYNGASSRMDDIDAMSTHTIKVFPNDEAVDILNNEIINDKERLEFDRLVCFQKTVKLCIFV